METMKEVSLGFAEFVSQLLHETFDAILSSQNYQLERIVELRRSMHITEAEFKSKHVTADDILTKKIELIGFVPKDGDSVSEEWKTLLTENSDSTENFWTDEKVITSSGLAAFELIVEGFVVNEKKQLLLYALNKMETTQLNVSSGEIVAKMELTSLFDGSKDDEEKQREEESNKQRKERVQNTAKSLNLEGKSKFLDIKRDKVKMRKIEDKLTGKDIIVLPRGKIDIKDAPLNKNDSLRLAAKPVTSLTSSNIYSTVTIKFAN